MMDKLHQTKIRLLNDMKDRGIRWSDMPYGLFDILVEQQVDNDNLLYFEGQMDLLTALLKSGVVK